jgi:hypothetical protein
VAVADGQPSLLKDKRDGWNVNYTDDLLGACGEVAASRGVGIPARLTAGKGRDGDLDRQVEVRTTLTLNGHLRLFDRDNPRRLFILVVGTPPHMHVVGGGRAGDMIATQYRDRGGDGWWIPQSALILTAEQIRDIVAQRVAS